MALVDFEIEEAIGKGELGIENFDPTCIQPASYDLRIGPLVYSGSEDRPDRPINLAENGGAYRIPPYGQVVLMTFETLKLPSTLVGRFGLTSSFTRKNLHASAGPQVDPGFEGKLFISLLNLTPRSHVVKYKEKFLSIEFNRLEHEPHHLYEGRYQGRTDIAPEILEDLLRFEGLNLSQMQSQFTELTHHIEQWSHLASKFDEFIQTMARHTVAVERLIEERSMRGIGPSDSSESLEALPELRSISVERAMDEILAHFGQRKVFYYSDIIEKLNLDLATIIEACDQLKETGKIEFDTGG